MKRVLFEVNEPTVVQTVQKLYLQESDVLSILLPGKHYTVMGPLLYYAGSVLLDKGYDMLSLTYNPQFSGINFNIDQLDVLLDSVKTALDQALAERQYKKIVFVGKSLGTIVMSKLKAHYKDAYEVDFVMLTPIPEYTTDMLDEKQMLVYGTQDKNLTKEDRITYQSRENITTFVVEGGDHSLDVESTKETIEHLGNFVTALSDYLK